MDRLIGYQAASGTNPNPESPYYPSIFNDVIGPIMRGPSSSHCAAAVRIGRLARDLMGGEIDEVLIQFDPRGSLATTHASQGSDMGLFGGLLGWETTDERLAESAAAIREAGIKVDIEIADIGAEHPNTYKLTLSKRSAQHRLTAISCGGGMVCLTEIDGVGVSIAGDYYETLLFTNNNADQVASSLRKTIEAEEILIMGTGQRFLIEIKSRVPLPDQVLTDLVARFGILESYRLSPILPVLSRRQIQVPYITCKDMLGYNATANKALWELAAEYESARAGMTTDEVLQEMRQIVTILQESILQGIAGTTYADRILGFQSGGFAAKLASDSLLNAGMLNQIILNVTALMEVKSSMGVIVAAPTAGACAALPGACIGAASAMGLGLEEMTRAMLAAGMIGVLIAARSTFAAEVCGCQAECGSGSAMAAAALVTLANGTAQQAVDAASMALQNLLGLICDPVANRVEVPCLGRNVLAASNALACANMALAGYDAVIPLDQVIETMDRVGKLLPSELRCTALAGLSVTTASKEIANRLEREYL
ncbi:MAG: L-serine ammonia-lyase, iron-sulfur-dependent, subunit alpha [Anaerolineae bacterium]